MPITIAPNLTHAREVADYLDGDMGCWHSSAPTMLRAMADELERLRAQVAAGWVEVGRFLNHDHNKWAKVDAVYRDGPDVVTLYRRAAPAQQAEPAKVQRLTDEEVAELYHEWRDCDGATFADLIRAVESRRAAAWGVNLEPTHD